MGFLSWIVRLLLLSLIIRMVVSAIFGSGRRSTTAGPRSAPRPRPRAESPITERAGGTLVRDPQCGTYLPESRAIRGGPGAEEQYFCSTACRDAYRASHSSVA